MTEEKKIQIKQQLFDKMIDGVSDESFLLVYEYSTIYGGKNCSYSSVDIKRSELIDLIRLSTERPLRDNMDALWYSSVADWIDDKCEGRGYDLIKYRLIFESLIPEELTSIYDDLTHCQFTEDWEIKDIREEIAEVGEGEYTFPVSIKVDGVWLDDLNTETIFLTQEEARGLLMENCNNKSLFEGLCETPCKDSVIKKRLKSLDYITKIKRVVNVHPYSEELYNYLVDWRKRKARLFKREYDDETYIRFTREICRNHTLENYESIDEELCQTLAEKALASIEDTKVTIKLSFDIDDSLHNGFDTCSFYVLSADTARRMIRGELREYDLGSDVECYEDWLDEMAHNYAIDTIKRKIMKVSQIPCELFELEEKIESLDMNDCEAAKMVQNEINDIKSGSYSFIVDFDSCDIPDHLSGFEDEVELTADEAKGLLMSNCRNKELFVPLGIKPVSIDGIKTKDFDVDSMLDGYLEYSAYSPELRDLINYWRNRIDYIFENGEDIQGICR